MKTALIIGLLLKVYPDIVFVEERSKVVFTAELQNSEQRNPTQIRVKRLEGSGQESDACAMKEITPPAETAPGNRIFTCTLSLKEKTSGMLSFHAEAEYADEVVPLRSKPAFITAVGGVTPKERKEMLRLQSRGQKLYNGLAKEKGLIQGRKETMVWLMKQQGVLGVRNLPNQDISVQFNSGATLWIRAPQEVQP